MGNILTIGLGFGDEGKGSFIDYLSSKYPENNMFIKYNGGCQARHTVNFGESGTFSFSQLSPSLFRNFDANLYLSCNFVINIQNLMHECEDYSKKCNLEISEILKRVYIDRYCVCVTPYHRLYNCEIEKKYGLRGSTGTGVSIAGLWSEQMLGKLDIYAEDLYNRFALKEKLGLQKEYVRDLFLLDGILKNPDDIEIDKYIEDIQSILLNNSLNIYDISDIIKNTKNGIFESSQGILLDEKYGFRPNTTYLDTSLDSLKNINGKRIGFIRSLYTRHGQGVFLTESEELNKKLFDNSQEIGIFNGYMRFGWFDLVLFRYSLRITNVKEVYMSYLDYLHYFENMNICYKYEYDGEIDSLFEDLFEFWIENNKIYVRNIKKSHSLLGKYMYKMKPCYMNLEFNDMGFKEKCDTYLSVIESESNVPITVISIGSNLSDKIERGLFDD